MPGHFTDIMGAVVGLRSDLEPKAKELRAEKNTYEQIAEKLGVAERTIRRWAKDWNQPTNSSTNVIAPVSYVVLDTADREWPNWTVDELADLPDFRADLWAVNIELIHAAERQGNIYVPWFFRNLVELAREREMPNDSLPWSVAIAGLPVLADWLNCPPCTELRELIEKHTPWVGRRQRSTYQREARIVSDAVKLCILQTHGRKAMEDYVVQRVSNGTKALQELGKRIPQFDRIPLRLRSDHVGKLLIDIFLTPKEG